jgi:hypothetical protein
MNTATVHSRALLSASQSDHREQQLQHAAPGKRLKQRHAVVWAAIRRDSQGLLNLKIQTQDTNPPLSRSGSGKNG